MWKWVLAIAAVPLGAAGLVVAVGALLPRDHVATGEARFAAPPAIVAATIRDVEAQPGWRRGVQAIEVVERRPAGLRYVERSADGAIAFDFAEESPGTRFRSRIADPSLPFGGEWTIALAPDGAGTRVRIEEHGTVRNPVYRFVSAWVIGHDRTLKAYLADLAKALS
jgi:hypothetical protein